MVMEIILMVCGAFWIISALMTNTRNIKSAIFFKVIPFFTGLATIVCAMDLLDWVNIF
jgi:hypothetical protein